MNGKDFLSLVRKRQSCRAYDTEKPVPDEVLTHCLEAARLAPSACNRQEWRFLVVRDSDTRNKLIEKGLLPGLAMREWMSKAPVLVALCVEPELPVHLFAALFSKVPYPLVDAGIAGEHFALAAAAEGLGTCWIGWIQPGAIRRILGIPRSVRVVGLFSVGYPSGQRESTPRKELSEIVFAERWSVPYAVASEEMPDQSRK